MAVQTRQKRGGNYVTFSSRLVPELYERLNDWAWERRTSMAAAAAILIEKALASETGEPYEPTPVPNHKTKSYSTK